MLTAIWYDLRPEQGGHPQYYNKDNFFINLCRLFKILHALYIGPWHGTLKDYINESSDKIYWNQFIWFLLWRSKKYQTGLKLGTYGGKVVGNKLLQILICIQLLHHSFRTNLLLLRHHHLTEYLLLKKINKQQYRSRLYFRQNWKSNTWLIESI